MSAPSIPLQAPSTPAPAPEPTDLPSSHSFLDIVRCSRCQRSLSIQHTSPPAAGVVQFGMNSYYCSRCASMVGFNR
ncbi:uncharacterized protein TRUGW13939_00369 [Talaromyces rugulosus]|uniref:Uncharacterized protein n=1 Tax=Talaromyces rugulosus TaxID=121627 RepID=A0A7H8QIG8_TALRU|nr:uncharacterized protein TRUGW13939_00369 [Talaromyces rugulosus]QKX53291.1 hypothetical protein TRUGW13939_00369 [Talaromyces rugulosus]